MEIFYKVTTEWCKYPFHDEVDFKYVEFFQKRKKKLIKIIGLKMETNTTIKEKLEYLKERFSVEVIKVSKIK